MKILFLFLSLGLIASGALPTQTFIGHGAGAVLLTFPRSRDYSTAWIDTLTDELNASTAITAADRADVIALLTQLTQLAAPPGTFGDFSRDVGSSHGTILIMPEPDYLVSPGHLVGTEYFVTVTLSVPSAPASVAPTIAWTSTPGSVASGAAYTVSAHAHDSDGNLAQVNVWKNGVPFAFAGGGNGTDGDSGNPTSDVGPQSVTFTAQAVDAGGLASAVISQVVTVGAPAPVQYTLVTAAGSGGTVSPGGLFTSGTTAMVVATADATHDFTGWSGDAGGNVNPVGVLMNANKAVQANFVLKNFLLTTGSTGGGTVTPGGVYAPGTTVTVTATADATHYFSGWAGDATGTVPSVLVLMDRSKSVQAIFSAMAAQTITFAPPGDHPNGAPPFSLSDTASSGLPVTFTVASGPATVAGNLLQLTGPGVVTVEASQPGNATTLPATPVTQTFNATALAILTYHGAVRTILQDGHTASAIPFILQP